MTGADKAFSSLRAKAALRGITVVRTDACDGPVRLFIERAGTQPAWRELRSVDDVEALLVKPAQLAQDVPT